MHQRQLQLLRQLDDGEFHHLRSLAEALVIAPQSVSESLRQLQRDGIDYQVRNATEFRLTEAIEWLDATQIQAQLQPGATAVFKHFKVLDCVASTSQWLAAQTPVQSGKSTVCLAESQSHGRGRLGRAWQSPPVANLYLSLNWVFEAGVGAVQGLSLAMGVAVAQACEALGVSGIGLKWPNDLVCAQGKLGGILIELGQGVKTQPSPGVCAIVGIGINVNRAPRQSEALDQAASDLFSLKGRAVSRNALVVEILNNAAQVLSNYTSSGLGPYLEHWRQRDVLRDREVTVTDSGRRTCGTALGIDDHGAYLVRTAQGLVVPYLAGTLRLRTES